MNIRAWVESKTAERIAMVLYTTFFCSVVLLLAAYVSYEFVLKPFVFPWFR